MVSGVLFNRPGVYKITNVVTGESYIGSSQNVMRRCFNHKTALNRKTHANIYLQRSWDKHGENSFVFEALVECGLHEIITHEQKMINIYNPVFNLRKVAGSNRGCRLSETTRKRMSESKKGKPLSDAQKKALNVIQKSRIGKPVYGRVKESLKLGPMACKGRNLSDDVKEKIRQTKIGKKFNKTTRRYE